MPTFYPIPLTRPRFRDKAGSGAARVAAFNGIGSLEIRGVTDAADKEAPQDFDRNLPLAMGNLFRLLEALAGRAP